MPHTYSQMYVTVSLVSNTFSYFQRTPPKDFFHTTSVKLHVFILNYVSSARIDTILGSCILTTGKFLLAYDQVHCNDQVCHYYCNRHRASQDMQADQL